LLAHPKAIERPIARITSGRVWVAERDGALLGFSALLPNGDDFELDGLFVEPACRARESAGNWSGTP
jgi:hypothetical protein